MSLDQVDVKVHVLENHVPHLRIGTEVTVEIVALPQRFRQGKIVAIIPRALIPGPGRFRSRSVWPTRSPGETR
ncbi:MAG: hypothetical protein Ct9H300mP1_35530 [Planctomycetaceae bacterium]|nr:MAG: hypothetical protein Ct9H300mP1_35530 [Planctomycetaceae bacterium]